jgi:hypothetical protein
LLFGDAVAVQGQENLQTSRLMRRGYLNLNGAYLLEGRSSRQPFSMELYGELLELDVHRAAPDDIGIDVATGLRLWGNLAIGLGATYSRTSDPVAVTGTVPHPLFRESPRLLSGYPLSGMETTQVAAHLQAVWMIPVTSRFDVMLSAGPSLFRVTRERISSVGVREAELPFNKVEVGEVGRGLVRSDVVGANLGLDFMFHLFRSLEPGSIFWTAGIGAFVRWTGAVPGGTGSETAEPAVVDRLQAGLGLRFRY